MHCLSQATGEKNFWSVRVGQFHIRPSHDSEVWRALATTDVVNVTQAQGFLDHQVLSVARSNAGHVAF